MGFFSTAQALCACYLLLASASNECNGVEHNCAAEADPSTLLQSAIKVKDKEELKNTKKIKKLIDVRHQEGQDVEEGDGVPTISAVFPMLNFEAAALMQMPIQKSDQSHHAATSWCFTVTTSAQAAHYTGQEEFFPEADAQTRHGLALQVTSEEGLSAGNYCCPGVTPGPGEMVKDTCNKVQSDRDTNSVLLAKLLVDTQVPETLGEADLKKAVTQIAQLARESADDTILLLHPRVQQAVLLELGMHKAMDKVFVKRKSPLAGWLK